MKTRRLGKTGLMVSEIGFGGEWLERHPEEEGIELIHYASSLGINILDCWMADPKSRDPPSSHYKFVSYHYNASERKMPPLL